MRKQGIAFFFGTLAGIDRIFFLAHLFFFAGPAIYRYRFVENVIINDLPSENRSISDPSGEFINDCGFTGAVLKGSMHFDHFAGIIGIMNFEPFMK